MAWTKTADHEWTGPTIEPHGPLLITRNILAGDAPNYTLELPLGEGVAYFYRLRDAKDFGDVIFVMASPWTPE